SPTSTPTATPTPTPTATPPPTPTPTPTSTPTPTPTPSSTPSDVTVTFDDQSADRLLTSTYAGVDWGNGAWYLSGPWGSFTTNSVSYAGPGPTSAAFTFLVPRLLTTVSAFNGGTDASTIALSCGANATSTAIVAPGAVVTLSTQWTASCLTVTVASS